MRDWKHFFSLMKSNQLDVRVLITTFFLTVFFHLIIAIEVGMILSSFIFMKRMSEATAINVSNNLLSDGQEHGDVLYDDDLAELPKETIMYEINEPLFFGEHQTFKYIITGFHQHTTIILSRMTIVPFTISK